MIMTMFIVIYYKTSIFIYLMQINKTRNFLWQKLTWITCALRHSFVGNKTCCGMWNLHQTVILQLVSTSLRCLSHTHINFDPMKWPNNKDITTFTPEPFVVTRMGNKSASVNMNTDFFHGMKCFMFLISPQDSLKHTQILL